MAAVAGAPADGKRQTSPIVTSSHIDRQTVGRAVDSLLKWLRAQTSGRKAQLLEHEEPLRLVLSLRKIPATGRVNPYLISLPHPLLPLSGPGAAEVCLIADDRPSAPSTPAAAEQRIREEGIPVSEVITLSALRSDYKAYEARRKLRGSYDVFVADRRILPLLPRLIGNSFFKKKKQPLPIDLSRKGWPEQLRRCLSSATLYIRTGTCCQLDVGRASQGREEIIENVIAAVEGAMPFIPKKWDNIRSIHLKFDGSVALPIFRALPEMGFKIETYQKNPSLNAAEEEEGLKKNKKKKKTEAMETRKGGTRQLRYTDAIIDASELALTQLDDDDDDDLTGQGEEEADGEKKASKKRKKEAENLGDGKARKSKDGSKKRSKKFDEVKTKLKKKKKIKQKL